MPEITGLKSLKPILPDKALWKLYLLTAARLFTNLLDLVGLAGVAAISLVFSSSFGKQDSNADRLMPLFGTFEFSESNVLMLALAVVLVFMLKTALSINLKMRTAQFVASVEVHFATKIARDYFTRSSKIESLSHFQNTVITSTEALSIYINSRIAVIVEAALIFLLVGMFAVVNPFATLGSLAYFGLIFFILTKAIRQKIKRKGERKMAGFRKSLETSRDLFGLRREIRAAGVFEIWIQKFSDSREDSARSGASIYALASIPRSILETALVVGIFLFIGGIVTFSDLRSEALTVGVFMAGGVRLSALLIPLQGSLNQLADGASRGRFAFQKLNEMALRSEPNVNLTSLYGSAYPIGLEMKNVSFSYHRGQPTLQNITFVVEPGQKVAIVGPSGAGKSTCFDLASGFLKPIEGEVLLGDKLAHELLGSGSNAIGVVSQRPHLMSGTLAENISLVSNSATDKVQVAECLMLAGLGHMSELSNLDKTLEPDAGELSGGEIQRVGLARALYRKPRILFLDEATSALDAQTEAAVSSALETLRGRMTIVLIAHRLSTVYSADKIIYLDQGKMLAQGTFSEIQELVPDFQEAVRLTNVREQS